MKIKILIIILFSLAILTKAEFAKATAVVDQQPDFATSAGSYNNFYQHIRTGTQGQVGKITLNLQDTSFGSNQIRVILDTFSNATTSAVLGSVAISDTQIIDGQNNYTFNFLQPPILAANVFYGFDIQTLSGGTHTFQAFGTTANYNYNCQTGTSGSAPCDNGVISLQYTLYNGAVLVFQNPPQAFGIPGSQMSDFLQWKLLLTNVATSTPTKVTITTGYGTDVRDISSYDLTSTNTAITLDVLKTYPLNTNASTTSSYLQEYAVANLINKNTGVSYASATNYFGILQTQNTSIPYYGLYGIPSTTAGTLFDLGGSNYFPPSSNQPIYNQSWIRESLGFSLPFVYFFQIGDILNNLATTTQSNASVTPISVGMKFFGSNATTTLWTVDNSTFTKIIPLTYWHYLRDLLALFLWIRIIPTIWSRVRSLWQLQK